METVGLDSSSWGSDLDRREADGQSDIRVREQGAPAALRQNLLRTITWMNRGCGVFAILLGIVVLLDPGFLRTS